jgi:hypothetical protein
MRLREYINFHILLPWFGTVVVDNVEVAVVVAVVVAFDVVVGVHVVVDVFVGAESTFTYTGYILQNINTWK